ncbi:predicted protein [Nematostella vectensis]|uniref:Serine/threonine-protein kinase 1 n=1 Tax=Nematostella vectensis TaxID=45351 RepID=A7RIK4_NEMVE|nr:predicted protein [Nematostella vectensis]|eukprot:XP_001640884.1 predicted protein [Nematostella vectensis]
MVFLIMFYVQMLFFEPSVGVKGKPKPVALYPLNALHETRDISDNELPPGIASNVTLGKGPDGRMGGSYYFKGTSSSYIEIPYHEKLNTRINKSATPSTLPYQMGVWYSVAFVYDYETGTQRLYLNGVKAAEGTPGKQELGTNREIRMGAVVHDPRYFRGYITCLQIYDQGLSQEEIKQVMHACTQVPQIKDTLFELKPGYYFENHVFYEESFVPFPTHCVGYCLIAGKICKSVNYNKAQADGLCQLNNATASENAKKMSPNDKAWEYYELVALTVPSPALEVTVSTAASLPRQRKRRACPIDVAITDEELRREYCLGAELGQGGYGKVVRADKIVRWRRFKRPKTVPVAIKYMPDDAYVAMSRFKDRIIPTEVHYLRKCHHVNIIELLAHYIMLDNEQTSRHVIVMERPAHCLDLFSFLEIQPRGRVKEKGARKIFRDVMRGVKYLDQRGILHNDIKPENILLEVEPADKTSTRPRCSERESATFPAIAGPSVEHASASGGSSTQCAFANKPKVIRAKLLDFGFATGRNADPKVSKFRG